MNISLINGRTMENIKSKPFIRISANISNPEHLHFLTSDVKALIIDFKNCHKLTDVAMQFVQKAAELHINTYTNSESMAEMLRKIVNNNTTNVYDDKAVFEHNNADVRGVNFGILTSKNLL